MGGTEAEHPKPDARFISKVVKVVRSGVYVLIKKALLN
jgi:hypothetical protein